jgi:hypothetical protein
VANVMATLPLQRLFVATYFSTVIRRQAQILVREGTLDASVHRATHTMK